MFRGFVLTQECVIGKCFSGYGSDRNLPGVVIMLDHVSYYEPHASMVVMDNGQYIMIDDIDRQAFEREIGLTAYKQEIESKQAAAND